MSKISPKTQLNSKLSELLNNLQLEINRGKENYSLDKLKWAISNYDPDYTQNYTRKEFESKYNIKIRSKEYRTEASNYIFHTEVKPLVEGNAKELFKQIVDTNDTGNIDRVIELVEDNIIFCHNLKKEDFGREYYNLSYGANRFNHRFEVIWFYNERNRHRLNKLINPTLAPSLDNIENPIIHFSEYPFLGIDIQQWIDFEKAYRFIPLLKEILKHLKEPNKGKIISKMPPLEQVIYIECLRNLFHDFDSFNLKKKLQFLNLITAGQNQNELEQIDALEKIINMNVDDYSELENNHSEWARLLHSISGTHLTNLRKKISEYNRRFIKKTNDKNNLLLSHKEIEYNNKTQEIRNKILKKQSQIMTLIKSIE
ncbi:hypothetical protein Q2T41_11500 [Maribacter confluentis]|uniref:Uncharacterized protein n=1 Tax=Maribacter confluentis TaxID=1656093 RepID=A0ABT8RQT9_9FLAO|nr:hypothetical protein [Maribacter confluentis]MDO1513281.1 hypothetical protein [Maribacter confluentis]